MLDLDRLRQKRRLRRVARKRHRKLYEQTHQRGFALAAARDGRAMRGLRKLVAKATAALPPLERVVVHSTELGPPHWGGGADVMGQFVAPFMAEKFGLPKGSGKRTPSHNAAIGGSSTSDHLTTRTDCFARDFPTFDGEDAARALAAALGCHTWRANSYDTFDVVIDGVAFRVQILWGAAIGHGDHVHVGIELVSA